MRKVTSIFMVIVLCLAVFVGCGTGTSSESLEELIALGAQYLVDGNYSEAVVAFDKAIKVDDKSVVAYVGLGDGNLGLEDYGKAGEAYEKAIAVDDQTVEAYIGRADAYLFEENTESAVAVLTEGYEATGNAELSNIVEEINAGTYEPSVLHIDWESIANSDSSEGKVQGEKENNKKLGARQEKVECGCGMDDGCYEIDEYNDLNQLTKLNHYWADGELDRYAIYEYDEAGNNIRTTTYTPAGEIIYSHEAVYNDNGEAIEEIEREGALWGWKSRESSSGFGWYFVRPEKFAKQVKETGYSASGEMGYIGISEYENGELIKTTYYDDNGNVTDTYYPEGN